MTAGAEQPVPPYHFAFDRNSRVLCTIFEGRYSLAVFFSAVEETRRHASITMPAAGILDFTQVTECDIGQDEIRHMATIPPGYPPSTPRIAVAPSDIMYGLFRMLQVFCETARLPVSVVRTLKEAHEELGIRDADFQKIA